MTHSKRTVGTPLPSGDVTVKRLTTMQPDTASTASSDTTELSKGVPETVKALLFGELVQRSMQVLYHYHSDLYWDVKWVMDIETNAQNPSENHYWFYYAANDTGTSIGTSRELVYEYRKALQLNVTLYYNEEDGWWTAIIIDSTGTTKHTE